MVFISVQDRKIRVLKVGWDKKFQGNPLLRILVRQKQDAL